MMPSYVHLLDVIVIDMVRTLCQSWCVTQVLYKLMQVKYFETKNDEDDPGHFGGGGVVVFA